MFDVSGEFDNLAEIHQELETARKQQRSLEPVETTHQELIQTRQQVNHWQTLKKIVPVWFATLGQQLWAGEMARLATAHGQLQSEIQAPWDEEATRKSQVETLREKYLQLGGSAIGDLEKLIELQEEILAEKTKKQINTVIWLPDFN